MRLRTLPFLLGVSGVLIGGLFTSGPGNTAHAGDDEFITRQFLTERTLGRYAHSIALDGEWLAVGSPGINLAVRGGTDHNFPGEVFLYRLDKTAQEWRLHRVMRPHDGEPGDEFGYSISIHRGLLAVAARGDNGVDRHSGSIRLYRWKPKQQEWLAEATLVAGDAAAQMRPIGGPEYGQHVAVGRNFVLVSATRAFEVEGAVYSYVRRRGAWIQSAQLRPSSAQSNPLAFFGEGLAVDGKSAVIRAPMLATSTGEGVLFEYRKAGAGWSQSLAIEDPDLGNPRQMQSDVLLTSRSIGPWPHLGSVPGEVRVYERGAADWSLQAILEPFDGVPGQAFGTAAAIHDNTIVVGSPRDPHIGDDVGSVYVFKRRGARWAPQAKIYAGDPEPDARFGQRVVLDGTWLVVGSKGAVYVFE